MTTSVQSGSQTATINTEHQLGTTITAAGTHVLVVGTANLVNGDELELRVYSKVRQASDSEQLAYSVGYKHAQGDLIKLSLPVPHDGYFKVTLKQIAGTGRAFPWNILAL
jgi:hypothetical protein